MKNLFLLPLAFCLLFLSACKQRTDYTKEIARLDSAAAVLKDVEKKFLSADTGSFRRVFTFSQEKLRFITSKLAADTVKKNTALLLTDAYEQAGNLQNLLDNKKFLERALREGQQRLSDLKHDLAEDLIEKNKTAEYVVTEIGSSRKLSETVNKTVEKANGALMKLDSLRTKITALADSLNFK